MRGRSSLVGVLLLVVCAATASAQPYTIKLKYDPEPGNFVTVRDITKSNGGFKLLDTEGNVLSEEEPSVEELIFTDTTLVGGNKREKYKRVYEKAAESKGDSKAKPRSYQGRTLVYEWQKDNYRLGVVDKPVLESKDYEKLLRAANGANTEALLCKQLSAGKPVKVGDTWKLDPKPIADAEKDVKVDPAKSTIEAKLARVYMKGKAQFGLIELNLKLAITKAFEVVEFEEPVILHSVITLEAAIDGSTTEQKWAGKSTGKGKGKYYQDKEVKGIVELDTIDEGTTERSAEKPDPKGKEVPVANFPSSDNLTWDTFVSKEGKFTADFPGRASVDTKKDGQGNTTTTVAVNMDKSTISYTITVTTFASDITGTDPKLILDASLKAFSKTAKSNKEIELNGFPGLEIVHESKEGDKVSHMMHRIYVVNNRMYQVIAVAPKDKKDILQAEKFFKSFKFEDKKDQ